MSAQLPETDVAHLPSELPDGLLVLDVREADEWSAGHIDGAVHVPLMQLPGRLAEVSRAPEAAGRGGVASDDSAVPQVLVVCRVGARSAQATAFLMTQGVDAVNLAGGMVAWHRAGRPMAAETGQTPSVR